LNSRCLRQVVLRTTTVVVVATTVSLSSLHAHSSLPTHVVAVGGDRAVIWNHHTASFDVHSLCDGSRLHKLDLGTAKPNHVLFDESRMEFFGTAIGDGDDRSYVWQWQVGKARPAVTPVASAGRLWSVHQQGGKRYVVYTDAGSTRIKLGEIDRSLNVIEVMDLPDLVPEAEGCIVAGPDAPADGGSYWIDFGARRVHPCKDIESRCDLPGWLQVTTGQGHVLLSEQACNTFYLMRDDKLVRQSPVPLAVDDAAIHRVFVDPTRDRAVYALAGSRADIPSNLELWKSTDEGASWRRIELNDRRPVNLFFTEKAVLVESAGPDADSSGLELTVLDKKGAPLRVMRLHTRRPK
jgi:hypothetical protein